MSERENGECFVRCGDFSLTDAVYGDHDLGGEVVDPGAAATDDQYSDIRLAEQQEFAHYIQGIAQKASAATRNKTMPFLPSDKSIYGSKE